MPRRQEKLKNALKQSSLMNYSVVRPIFDRRIIESSDFEYELLKVYQELGGIRPQYPIDNNLESRWDIEINGFVIELDEEQHFNRYRKVTLQSSAYEKIPFTQIEYAELCENKEEQCLGRAGYGGYWVNPSTISQFGNGDLPRTFQGNGSPRWKQRAFYDFYKDIGCHLCKIGMIRIPIYLDEYIKVEQSDNNPVCVEELVQWILYQIKLRQLTIVKEAQNE